VASRPEPGDRRLDRERQHEGLRTVLDAGASALLSKDSGAEGLTRDPWMHRLDLARATGHAPVLTADHGGVIVAVETAWDVVFLSQQGKLRDRSNTNADIRDALDPLGFGWVTRTPSGRRRPPCSTPAA
jgi:hypothetical protein